MDDAGGPVLCANASLPATASTPAQSHNISGLRNYENMAYPNNLLRSVAVEAAGTPFVLVIDADMMPSEGLREEFRRVMQLRPAQPGPRVAFVVAAFERDSDVGPPRNRSELVALWDSGRIRCGARLPAAVPDRVA